MPGAPDLEVRERDLEPGAELGRLEDRLEPLARLVESAVATPVEQVGVGPPRRSPDPPAQLVELGEPERVGVVDDDRVHVRDVEAGLDDRRADQDVGLARREVEHHLLEGSLVHLAVADDDPGLGQQRAQLVRLRLDRLDPVVDEEDLAAAVQLAQDRLPDEAGRRLGDVGLDRQPIFRRRLDRRHVADADERHVQRARDRRRRQRQDVDLAAQLLEALLVRDAEALLLVDDDQAEVLERDVLLEEPVRADDDVDRAGREPATVVTCSRVRDGTARASRRSPGSRRGAR